MGLAGARRHLSQSALSQAGDPERSSARQAALSLDMERRSQARPQRARREPAPCRLRSGANDASPSATSGRLLELAGPARLPGRDPRRPRHASLGGRRRPIDVRCTRCGPMGLRTPCERRRSAAAQLSTRPQTGRSRPLLNERDARGPGRAPVISVLSAAPPASTGSRPWPGSHQRRDAVMASPPLPKCSRLQRQQTDVF
jgi:hypothetical protein